MDQRRAQVQPLSASHPHLMVHFKSIIWRPVQMLKTNQAEFGGPAQVSMLWRQETRTQEPRTRLHMF